jgi:hypothetical protein
LADHTRPLPTDSGSDVGGRLDRMCWISRRHAREPTTDADMTAATIRYCSSAESAAMTANRSEATRRRYIASFW